MSARRTTTTKGGAGRALVAKASAWLAMLALAVGALLGITSAAYANGDDDELSGAMSFYALASSTSSFLGNSLSPDNDVVRIEAWDTVTKSPASGGSMLGYSDNNRNDGANWISSAWTKASHTMSYEAFSVKEDGADPGVQPTDAPADERLNGVIDYTHFGATLAGLGLDKTKTGLGLNFVNFFGGGIVRLLFIASFSVDWLFGAIVSVLSTLNPFRLFFGAINAISPEFANGMVGGDTSTLPSGLAGLASFISQWYSVLNNMAWTVMVPVFMAVLVVSLLLFKNMNKGGAVKKFLVRVAFLGLGLPLIGSMYTGALTAMEDATGSGNEGSTRVVASTFVDFESWVMNKNLGFPDNATIEWNASRSRPSDESLMNVRETTLAINKAANWRFYLVGPAFDESGSWAEQAQADTGNTPFAFNAADDLLSRYMSGDMITASDYETQVKGALTKQLSDNGGEDAKRHVTAWFKAFQDDGKINDPGHKTEGIPLNENIVNNGMLVVNEGSGLTASPSGSTTGLKQFTSSNSRCKPSMAGPSNCNLAPLAMYNYLNTTFGPESYTVYSAENSTSGATREVHNSVNLVGTGLMSMVYWLNAVILLGAFVIIGFGYAIGMAISNIRRSLQIITAVPFATLGALAGIAKVIIYTLALIIELMMTIFVYMLVQEFLISLPQIIEMPFATFLNTGTEAAILTGSALATITGLVTIVTVVAFTVMALRLRKTLVKAVEEAVTKLVNKFLETGAGAPSMGGSQVMPALAGGLSAGAGAAAMNKAIGGKSSGGPTSSAGGTGGAAPSSISTEDGSSSTDGAGGAEGNVDVSGSVDAGGTGADGAPTSTQAGDGSGSHDSASHGSGSEVSVSGESGSMSVSTDTATTERGRDVAAHGLSDPTAGDPVQGAGANQDDAMSAASQSAQSSAEEYKDADKANLEAGKEGAQAVGHGAVAAGAAAAGNSKVAAEHGSKAVAAGAEANAKRHEAKATSKQAGRSNTDQTSSGAHAKKAQRSRQVGQAAGAAGAVKGSAGGTSSTPSSGGRTPSAPRPSGGKSSGAPTPPKAPQKAPQAPRAPQHQRPGPQQSTAQPQASQKGQTPRPQQGQAPRPQRQQPTPSVPQRGQAQQQQQQVRQRPQAKQTPRRERPQTSRPKGDGDATS